MVFTRSRRAVLFATAVNIVASIVPVYADDLRPIKIGLILPYKGVWAAPVENIDRGFRVAMAEFGGKVAGRPVEVIRADDELTSTLPYSASTSSFSSIRSMFWVEASARALRLRSQSWRTATGSRLC